MALTKDDPDVTPKVVDFYPESCGCHLSIQADFEDW